jgi:hypothetical protein
MIRRLTKHAVRDPLNLQDPTLPPRRLVSCSLLLQLKEGREGDLTFGSRAELRELNCRRIQVIDRTYAVTVYVVRLTNVYAKL